MPKGKHHPPTRFAVMPALSYWSVDGKPVSHREALSAMDDPTKKVECLPTEIANNLHEHLGWFEEIGENSMQFRLHINNTNDGKELAQLLRRLASQIDGDGHLNNGFTRNIEGANGAGYAIMEINSVEYDDCATAERTLGMTLEWKEENLRWVGYAFGHPHAVVKKTKPTPMALN